MKVVIITEGYQKARQHKEYTYPYVELAKKALQNMREVTVKNIAIMRYENQVSRNCAHAR